MRAARVASASATVEQPFARRAMRDRVQIGQAWRRRRDRVVMRIRQIHRADRVVELVDGAGDVHLVAFRDLRTYWREVDV